MNVSPEGLVHLWIVVDVTIVRFASWTDQSRYIPILNILDVTIVNVPGVEMVGWTAQLDTEGGQGTWHWSRGHKTLA